MKSRRESLDTFGKFLMEHLRDRAIDYYDGLASGHWKAPSLAQLQTDLQLLDERQRSIARRCVVSAVDHALHDFLFALQERADFENDIQIFVDGANIAQLSDGLQFALFTDEGWPARFSKFGESPDVP